MIVVTTPTGQIGSQVVDRLLDRGEPLRLIARDAAKLSADVRDRVEVLEGSHCNPVVLDQALPGADALFWLVPPDPWAPSARDHYMAYARAVAQAMRRNEMHVVGVSSAGHGWSKPAGVLSAAFAMDDELDRCGAPYRALSMPFYMENLSRQLSTIQEQGVFSLTYRADRPLPMIATGDIAETAAALLTERTWTGHQHIPLFGPDNLTPPQMAGVMSDVLERPVSYHRLKMEDFASQVSASGVPDAVVQDLVDMNVAVDDGLYEPDWVTAKITATTFRTWFSEAHATRAVSDARTRTSVRPAFSPERPDTPSQS